MESISSFKKETDTVYHLKAAYVERWSRLMNSITKLSEEELNQLSNPSLLKCLPSYLKAKKKVLFIGQETNGWDSFRVTLDTFNVGINEEANRDCIIEYLQWMYEDLRFHRKWDYTPFWKGMRRFYQAIVNDGDDDGFLHTELVRFDFDQQRPPHHIEDLLQKEYNVLPMEISALNPDVVIFLTGPYYDDRLRETFLNYYALGDLLKFEMVEGLNANQLSRVSHPSLPNHTYRTYHPGYSLRYEKEIFNPVESFLKGL